MLTEDDCMAGHLHIMTNKIELNLTRQMLVTVELLCIASKICRPPTSVMAALPIWENASVTHCGMQALELISSNKQIGGLTSCTSVTVLFVFRARAMRSADASDRQFPDRLILFSLVNFPSISASSKSFTSLSDKHPDIKPHCSQSRCFNMFLAARALILLLRTSLIFVCV
jgi:hypothetical protein